MAHYHVVLISFLRLTIAKKMVGEWVGLREVQRDLKAF